MRGLLVLIAACGGATPTPIDRPRLEEPYARLFDANARWELPAHMSLQLQADQAAQQLDGSMWCVVTKATAIDDARVSWLECGTSGELKKVVATLPRNEFVATPAGLWTTGTDTSDAVATRADVDAIVHTHAMRVAAVPAARHVEIAAAERKPELLAETIDTFKHGASWCLRHRQSKPGEVADSTMCLSATEGITGGDAWSWREQGFVATLTFGDDPPDRAPDAVPPK